MTKTGLIDSPKGGVFIASAAGRDLLASRSTKIDVESLKTYPAFVAFHSAGVATGTPSEAPAAAAAALSSSTPEEQIDAANGVLASALRADLLTRILEQRRAFFERVIVDLLVAMGYGGSHENAAMRLGKSGDGGINGIVDEDRLGLDRIYVQAKRYAVHVCVGRPEIQGFVGSLVGRSATKGVFVTTSNFSGHAIEYVRGLQQRVILIDGARLAELLVEFNVGVRVSRTVQVKRLDEDFFNDDA